MLNLSNPDLTQYPQRSIRVRLGGYAHLPRLLYKARAEIAGKNGEYHYNCPVDERLFAFTGIKPEEMLAAIKTGKSDTEMLAWVNEHCSRQMYEIMAWSVWLEQHGPGSVEGHEWLASVVKADAPEREDIRSFAELLDLDDYVTFGGKA